MDYVIGCMKANIEDPLTYEDIILPKKKGTE